METQTKITAKTIQDHISYVVDAEGRTTAMLVDLKDKKMQEWAEDFADLLPVNQDREEETVDFLEAMDEVITRKEQWKPKFICAEGKIRLSANFDAQNNPFDKYWIAYRYSVIPQPALLTLQITSG